MNIYRNERLVCSASGTDRDAVLAEIENLMAIVTREDQVVKEIFIDGQDVTGRLEDVLASGLSDVREIRFMTVGKHEMFSSLVQDFRGYLPNVIRANGSISDLFYGDVTEDALSLFQQLLDSLTFVSQFLQTIKNHLQQTNGEATLFGRLVEFERALVTSLGQLERAMQDGDYVLFGDILKYEVGELLENLQDMLEKSEWR